MFGGDFGNGKKREREREICFHTKSTKSLPSCFSFFLSFSLMPWLHFKALIKAEL